MLTVKFMARQGADLDPALWTALLPEGDPESFGVRFVFDPDARAYDYLVVYEGLTFRPGEGKSNRVERLACARANTLFVTTEPASIKVYGNRFLGQFGHVLTRQAIDHPGHIDRTPPLRPYYGRPLPGSAGRYLSYDDLAMSPVARTGVAKRAAVSVVSSDKTMTPALKARYDFVMGVRDLVDVYGRGIRPIDQKAEAMDGYAYHIAIENHVAAGHWTEKISDTFLAECLALYHGDPEIGRAFPQEAVLPIDIAEPQAAREIIARALRDDLATARRSAVLEAKRRVLEDHNTLRVVAEIAQDTHDAQAPRGGDLMGRHAWRRAHPVLAARDAVEQRRVRGRW